MKHLPLHGQQLQALLAFLLPDTILLLLHLVLGEMPVVERGGDFGEVVAQVRHALLQKLWVKCAALSALGPAGHRELQAAHSVEIVLPQLHAPGEALHVGAGVGARSVEVGGGHVGEQVHIPIQHHRPKARAPPYFRGYRQCDEALDVLGEGVERLDVCGRDIVVVLLHCGVLVLVLH